MGYIREALREAFKRPFTGWPFVVAVVIIALSLVPFTYSSFVNIVLQRDFVWPNSFLVPWLILVFVIDFGFLGYMLRNMASVARHEKKIADLSRPFQLILRGIIGTLLFAALMLVPALFLRERMLAAIGYLLMASIAYFMPYIFTRYALTGNVGQAFQGFKRVLRAKREYAVLWFFGVLVSMAASAVSTLLMRFPIPIITDITTGFVGAYVLVVLATIYAKAYLVIEGEAK